MNYHFRIISDEVEDFIFDVLIDSSAFFIDLHNFIQKTLDFDKSQIASFFITDSDWNKDLEITLLDMMGGDNESMVMDNVRLHDLINNKHQRMLYMFDMLSDRVLFIELIDINNKKIKTPVCLRLDGEPPKPTSEDFDLDENNFIPEEIFEEDFEDAFDDIFDEDGYEITDLSSEEDYY